MGLTVSLHYPNALKPNHAFAGVGGGLGTAEHAARADAMPVEHQEVTFTQTTGNGTYTGTIAIEAGETLVALRVIPDVAWTGTSASLVVGDDDDPDGFVPATDLKAAPGTDSGEIDITGDYTLPKLYAGAKTITATVVQVGTGTAGRMRLEAVIQAAITATAAASKA